MDLASLRPLSEAATAGEWTAGGYSWNDREVWTHDGSGHVGSVNAAADAAFLVAAVNAVRAAMDATPDSRICPTCNLPRWPGREDFAAMSVEQINAYFAGIGASVRVVDESAETPTPEPEIDVERLARAIWTVYPFPGSKPARADIERIAAAYRDTPKEALG